MLARHIIAIGKPLKNTLEEDLNLSELTPLTVLNQAIFVISSNCNISCTISLIRKTIMVTSFAALKVSIAYYNSNIWLQINSEFQIF